MELTMHIPDDLAIRLDASSGELSRRAPEAFTIEELKAGRVTHSEMGQLLGYSTRNQLDGFLRDHGILYDYTFFTTTPWMIWNVSAQH